MTDLLDAIGKLLSGILDLLKKMLQAAVKAVVAAVKAVLDFASKLLSALGDWMLIAVDFLSDPGGWLGCQELGGGRREEPPVPRGQVCRQAVVHRQDPGDHRRPEGRPRQAAQGRHEDGRDRQGGLGRRRTPTPLIIGELVMTKVVAKLIPGRAG
ncbi:hypothetical protein NKH18_40855 [Streptomyces sp. M10(2022)]